MKSSNEGMKRTASETVEVGQTSRRIREAQNKEKPPAFSEEFLPKRRIKSAAKMGQLDATSSGVSNAISKVTSPATSAAGMFVI